MARILLHSLVFPPDGNSTSNILSDLMLDLQAKGHRITVLTTHPHNNRDLDAEALQPLQKRLGGLYYVSNHYGMSVIHTFMPPKGQRLGARARDYLIFHILSLILGTLLIGRQDIVIAPSPPLSIGVIGWLLATFKGAKFIYNVRELYPALMVQMGLISASSRLYRIMAWMERFVYARSVMVVVISDQFRQHVISLGFPPEKVVVIPDFVDIEFVKPLPRNNALSLAQGLTDKYVVLYAGNIGMTQSFDTIVEVAARLIDKPAIHFLIVGDGARRDYVFSQIQQRRLVNVTLLPYQPRSEVPDIYATADLNLIPLMAGMARTTIPSKIYTIMASGRPALVAVDMDSEIVGIVQEALCGLAVPPDDPSALEAGIRKAFDEQEQFRAYGVNGRRYVEIHFSRHAVNERFHELIEAIVNPSAST